MKGEGTMSKEVYCLADLATLGYPKTSLYDLARSEDFTDAGGFRIGEGKRAKIYFNRKQLDSYLRRKTNER